MLVDEFDYYLPESLIAQKALEPRDSSRLLVLDRTAGSIEDKVFTEITSFLNPGDLLVMNDTRVIPARLLGEKKGTRGRAEVLLLREREPNLWEALVKPGARLKEGAEIVFGDGLLEARIEKHLEEGLRLIKFSYQGSFMEILDKLGQMPLPPYIHSKLEDNERYQTIYSKNLGSAAAPTAGLHFTKELLQDLTKKGIDVAYVTLHVGLGTFRPVSEKTVENHKMHTEVYDIPKETWQKVEQTKKARKKVVAVGTTVVRTLEACAISGKLFGETAIFIYPGFDFKIIDCMITNFHLPKSTLLMLVSAFAGRENILKAYKHAVANKYRFYSFGDAMLIT
ncbi:MAG: tRNA preQ1(34) S-adenosylmethionine ribosyltransferase-isomerase QueA [Firmicutes bacterium]|nr:tRNA preQ1(34) S-adenosylmethionine ribosyltransferase-isomerase QueA [Bacillota bacterium]MDD4263869.1 tRNA preQ1(34) S-adenosylmethionine ribosyltransferase-isomerase QueA [Bacillota bacterium]MDD4692952.1 tRNA preQ1(34) S-adenosylmethionine ribosyltransferase-isomerase QueA [Bacillota bacterium]